MLLLVTAKETCTSRVVTLGSGSRRRDVGESRLGDISQKPPGADSRGWMLPGWAQSFGLEEQWCLEGAAVPEKP